MGDQRVVPAMHLEFESHPIRRLVQSKATVPWCRTSVPVDRFEWSQSLETVNRVRRRAGIRKQRPGERAICHEALERGHFSSLIYSSKFVVCSVMLDGVTISAVVTLGVTNSGT